MSIGPTSLGIFLGVRQAPSKGFHLEGATVLLAWAKDLCPPPFTRPIPSHFMHYWPAF